MVISSSFGLIQRKGRNKRAHARWWSSRAINQHSPVIVICPLTDASHFTKLYPSDVRVAAPEGGLAKDSVILTAQVRAIAKSRLLKRLGELGAGTMKQMAVALKITLNLP